MSTQLPKIAVIGAGSSGITALKGLVERGFDAVAFEASDRVGGNWVIDNKNGMSAAYTSLHINTSKPMMEYRDFPMPEHYPDFPHHTNIAEYFDDYVEHFGLRERIRFETKIVHAELGDDGVWLLTDDSGAAERVDALVVANGHHWDPRWPEPAFAGSDSFEGEQIHAHAYRDSSQLAGRKVVVVGMGNSAMDIAVEASYAADRVYLAARRGAYIVPKYLFGRPLDQVLKNDPRIPFKIRQKLFELVLRSQVGKVEAYGLPKPDHNFAEAHPTISDPILSRITHGAITVKPNIRELKGDRVVFEDGSEVESDLIVYCTGYKITFPFFDEDLISAPDNRIELFERIFKPGIDNLFFVGLLQPLGAIMPLAEMQSRWIASYLHGEYRLPSEAQMNESIKRERAAMEKRYVASKRHTIQVDFDDYMRNMEREMRAGSERARAEGFTLPVEPKAGAALTA